MSDEDTAYASFGLLDKLPEEEQLRLLRDLLDTVPDAVVAHGPDGDVVFFSNGMCALLGYTREELAQLRPYGWVEREAMRGAPGRLEAILHDGRLSFESRAVRKDGSVIPTFIDARRIDTRLGPLVVSVIRDTSALKRAQDDLAFLAYHDPLTGLANRTALTDRLNVCIADARRHRDSIAVAYVDLDRFKPINDEFGHAFGDRVLAEVGRRLTACVRSADLVARIGGDEFVVLLPRMHAEADLMPVAGRLLSSIREPIEVGAVTCEIDATVGFATLDPETDDARSIVMKADLAMYAAKRDAPSSWRLWDESLGLPRDVDAG